MESSAFRAETAYKCQERDHVSDGQSLSTGWSSSQEIHSLLDL